MHCQTVEKTVLANGDCRIGGTCVRNGASTVQCSASQSATSRWELRRPIPLMNLEYRLSGKHRGLGRISSVGEQLVKTAGRWFESIILQFASEIATLATDGNIARVAGTRYPSSKCVPSNIPRRETCDTCCELRYVDGSGETA